MGGEEATITDARVLLGHLNGQALLAGRLPIKAARSEAAVQKLAEQIDMELLETAKGIVAVSNSNIIKEIKNATVAKGYNPSDFCLVAFGGSGPLHAAELIDEMMIQKALIPKTPGLLAAYGLLTENMRRDFVQTRVTDLAEDLSLIHILTELQIGLDLPQAGISVVLISNQPKMLQQLKLPLAFDCNLKVWSEGILTQHKLLLIMIFDFFHEEQIGDDRL